MTKIRVLLTGAAGDVGQALLKSFSEAYHLRTLDMRPVPGDPNAVLCNLQDFPALREAMQGIEVLVHLAAASKQYCTFMEDLLPNNIIGLYNVLQAAHETDVRRIVFASSCHTVGAYPPYSKVRVSDPIKPDSLYGISKIFGEVLGCYYHDFHGIEFIAIRIGAFQKEWKSALTNNWHWLFSLPGLPGILSKLVSYYQKSALKRHRRKLGDFPELLNIGLSQRDLITAFRQAVEKPDIGYGVVFVTSRSKLPSVTLASARKILGFEPQDTIKNGFPDLWKKIFNSNK